MKTFVWSWRLMCRWLVEAYFDNTTGLAAMMAYDLIFILVAPGFLLLSALLSLFGTDPTLLHKIIELLEGFLPEISKPLIEQQVVALVITGATSRVALLGIPLALYLGINLINTISRTLNHCLGIKEPQRSWWNRWIIAVLLLFWLGATSLFSCIAIVFGERMAATVEATFHLQHDLQGAVTMLKYPIIALALIVLALALYLLTPEIYQTIWQALPGAVFFSVGWLAATAIFGLLRQRAHFALQRDLRLSGRLHRAADLDVGDVSAAAAGGSAQRRPRAQVAHAPLGPPSAAAGGRPHRAGCRRPVGELKLLMPLSPALPPRPPPFAAPAFAHSLVILTHRRDRHRFPVAEDRFPGGPPCARRRLIRAPRWRSKPACAGKRFSRRREEMRTLPPPRAFPGSAHRKTHPRPAA